METFDFYNELVSLQGDLKRFAMRLTSDHEEAKDLTQDTFLKALAFREQFVDTTNLRAWTFTIMKNTFINQYRKRVRQNMFFDKSASLFLLNQPSVSSQTTPESAYCEKEITMAINRLDNEAKVPFVMYIHGYKYKDIAQMLGLKLGTVKSRIFFTRKKLANSLSGYN